MQRLINSKEHKPVFWIFILLVAFYLKTHLVLRHLPMTEKSWTLSGIALALILLDVIYEFNKKKLQVKV